MSLIFFLFFCTEFVLLATDPGKALSLSLPSSPPLTLAPINPLDKNQHFQLEATSGGNFIVSRPKGQVFDVTSMFLFSFWNFFIFV
jgi:hypothetical protein